MFNRNLEYVIREVPTEDRQELQDLLNEMSSQGWDLYTLHEVETEEDEFMYSCIFMREKMASDEEEVFDKVVNIKNFKAQMEKMLSNQLTPYETCKDITAKIRDQKARVANIKSEIEKVDWSDRGALNEQMSGALRRLDELKQSLVKEISPGIMYSRIGEEKFTINLSEELIDFVSPDNKNDLLSETVKSRQKLTDELGYVIPRMVFQDDDTLAPYEFSIKVHNLEVYKSTAVPDHTAFFKDDVKLSRKPSGVISVRDNITGKDIWWIDSNQAADFWADGFTPVEYIARAIEFVSVKYVSELLDYSDINRYVSLVEQRNPFVINNIIPDFISLSELKYILINLIRERISIKDIDYIFEKINDFSDEPSKDGLLDRIRLSLSKHISQRFLNPEAVGVIEFSGNTLDEMFKLTETEDETIIKVDGKVAGKLAKKMEKIASEKGLKEIILIVPMEIRHMTFSIFSEFMNNLTVIAHEELTCDTNLDIIATI
ncbi:MAG: flagellar biosynthesis protein FlhA [Candidatus Gastranaerophilales bacterium]|nr:flagellar biosynthesis protein FlhA [Candidatus Gastranaerophilales bacterium]